MVQLHHVPVSVTVGAMLAGTVLTSFLVLADVIKLLRSDVYCLYSPDQEI